MRNLQIAFPELPIEEHERILRAAARNVGRVMATDVRMFNASPAEALDLLVYEPDEKFTSTYKKSVESGQGRILVSGHIGNWELWGFTFPLLFEPFNFLARRMDNPLIDEYFMKARTRYGNVQIDKENSARAILSILRKGGAVAMLADVNSHPKEGVFAPFFGIDACTTSGVAMLALRANAVIVPMWAIWDEKLGKFRLVHDEIIEPVRTGDRTADIEATTALHVAATERIIRAYPDQWTWVHRRWKTRPPGEPELY